MSDAKSSNLRSIRSALICLAAKLVRGEGVPDWSEHKFYRSTPRGEQREMLKALRDADDALRRYGIQLKDIADKLPVGSSAETAGYVCTDCSGTGRRPDLARALRKESSEKTSASSAWNCVHCGRDNAATETHCTQCDWSRKHTVGGILHERTCSGHPCRCGAGTRQGDAC